MNIQLINGDCLVEMAHIADKSVDLILCDLPYGTTACKWDTIIPFEPLWAHYKRIIKDNGAIVLTASQPFTSALVMSNIKWFRYEMIWEKSNVSSPLLANKRPLPKHENILIFYQSSATYNPQKTSDESNRTRKIKAGSILASRGESVYGAALRLEKEYDKTRFPVSIMKFQNPPRNNQFTKDYSLHPTQKPVALMEYLIKTYTNEGDLVLDNCMGSGTTGVACVNTNRSFIGIEKELNYFEICQKRIDTAKLTLF